MSVSALPKRIVRLHRGSDPDQISLSPIFIRRLDVIVPTRSGIEAHLVGQVPKYTIRSGVRLDDVLSSPEEFRTSSSITSVREDEAWYIDGQRGMLVLKVPKERYQALGIVGKESGDAYIIQVDLKDATTRIYSRAKEAFKAWDKAWEVWTTWVANELEPAQAASAFKNVEPERVVLEDVLVPTAFPMEEIEDDSWVELFEWVGMCSIGSPRISSTDQVNSYVSAYSAPEGSRTGSVTRFRWEGLLSEKFVQRIIQVARDEIKQGLFAFSLASFSHVSTYPPVTGCESCAGVVAAAEWALAEVVAPR